MDELDALLTETDAALAAATDLRALDAVRVGVLGKQGRLTGLLKALGAMPPEERRERGAGLNRLRDQLTQSIETRRAELEQQALAARLASERLDITLPPPPAPTRTDPPHQPHDGGDGRDLRRHGLHRGRRPGHRDRLVQLRRAEHPRPPPGARRPRHLLPARHPRRPPLALLRTQTSDVQIISMLAQEPPLRVIAPGRTYRADHDATHSPMFHQCEGLAIDESLTLGHLKGCLIDFLRAFFGIADLPVRFRASYFPFTEPSMEVDIGWDKRSGELGRAKGREGDWLEILGSGMVHPRVLANCGLDPRRWQGFAFGMGVERVAMLKHGIPDLRPFYESDLRWLRHYGTNPLMPSMLHEGVGS